MEDKIERKKAVKASAKSNNHDCFSVLYPTEKARAVKKYILKRGINLEDKFVAILDDYYKKYVPKEVREYIEESNDFKAADPLKH